MHINFSIKKSIRNMCRKFNRYYRLNKRKCVTIMAFGLIALFVVGINFFGSLARVGFNQNATYGDTVPVKTWYSELIENSDKIIYQEWDGTAASSFAGGNGTENNPYLIENGNQLLYLSQLIMTSSVSGRYFKLIADIDMMGIPFQSIGNNNHQFNGFFDGNYKIIKNLNPTANGDYQGLFGYTNNGSVYNVVLTKLSMDVSKGGTVYAGGLVGYADVNSKIYNSGIQSGTVTASRNDAGTGYVGTLVGYMPRSYWNIKAAVVTNCYSGANIYSTSGNNTGTYFGGIVGYRDAGNGNGLNRTETIVYLLAYYGDINVSSYANYNLVYNGVMIDSSVNPSYCYYLWRNDRKDVNKYMDANYAIVKTHDQMISDGFYAHLNNYRYMVSYYLNFDNNVKEHQNNGYNKIGVWYIDNSKMNYPILKEYNTIAHPEYIQYKTTLAEAEAEYFDYIITGYKEDGTPIYKVKSFNPDGTPIYEKKYHFLKVNLINSANNNETKTYYINITDKDPSKNDYTNHKIILPFNSASSQFRYSGNGLDYRGYEMNVNGWKLSGVKYNNTWYTTKTSGESINFNYVLREGQKGATKDIGTIYAEGGYYLVPDDVTEVNFTTIWAHTIYLRDSYNEVVYNKSYIPQNSSSGGYGQSVNEGDGKTPNSPVTTLSKAYDLAAVLGGNYSMNEVIVMLCGNYHLTTQSENYHEAYPGNSDFETRWPAGYKSSEITIKSMDRDGNLDPDYSFYTRSFGETTIKGIRLDFVNFLSIPQVSSIKTDLGNYNVYDGSNFEITETAVTDRIDLRIYNCGSFRVNGGNVNIFANDVLKSNVTKMNYIYIGGKAYAGVMNYGNSSTENGTNILDRSPIFVVAGGRVGTLSSTYLSAVAKIQNKVYFYVDGGYIDKFYVTYNGSLLKNATVEINGSYVNNYYAGGHTSSSNVAQGITTTIKNAVMGDVYGGPEYGSVTGKSVLYISDSTINSIYGSGFGGTQTTEVGLSYKNNTEAAEASKNGLSNPYCGMQWYNGSSSENDINKNSQNYNISLRDGTGTAADLNRTSESKTYLLGRIHSEYGIETGFYAKIYTKITCPFKSFALYYSDLSTASVDYVQVNVNHTNIKNNVYGGGNKGIVNNSVEVNITDNSSVGGSVYGGGLSNENEQLDVYESVTGYIKPAFISYSIDSEAVYPQKVTYTWSDDSSKFNTGTRVNKYDKLLYSPNVSKLGKVYGDVYLNIADSTVAGDVYGGGQLSDVEGSVHVNLYGLNNIQGSVYGGGNEAKVTGSTDVHLMGGKYDTAYAGGNYGEIIGTSSITCENGEYYTNSKGEEVLNKVEVGNLFGGGNNSSTTNTNIYLISGVFDKVYGGANNAGIVNRTNVHTGDLNTSGHYYSPAYPSDPVVEPDEYIKESETLEESDYLPDNDRCQNRDITFSYAYDRSAYWNNFEFTVNNETDNAFVRYQIRMELTNISQISDYTGMGGTYNSSTHVYSVNTNNSRPIPAHGSLTITSDAGGNKNGYYHPIDRSVDMKVVWVTIKAWDRAGNEYDYDICHDVLTDEGDDSGDVFTDKEKDPMFNYTRPADKTVIDEVEITELYGGNNKGGKTINSSLDIKDPKVTVGTVYGGGNLVETDNASVTVRAGKVGTVYGGGNQGVVNNNTIVNIRGIEASGSIYGGGNGVQAIVYGNSTVNIYKDSDIAGSVFGGGNAAETGTESSNGSKATVNIIGGTIHGNVYGGANTSKIWGTVDLNIGVDDDDEGPIVIGGTVFGGGEANAEGSEIYDYKYISVTTGIDIDIISSDTHPIKISGSIFGSGNASSTSGYSNILIKNLGTRDEPNRLISIQRAETVDIYNSVLEITGTTDRTNEYSSIVYSLSRLDEITIANDTVLYLQNGANVVTKFNSKYCENDEEDEGVSARVTINEDGTIDRNTDNRIYMLINKSLNILDDEILQNGTFGEVNGMTFFGLYEPSRSLLPDSGMYDEAIQNGQEIDDNLLYQFISGSYVMGQHKVDHLTNIDGFYSNFASEEDHKIKVDYIEPEPKNSQYYQWIIGAKSSVIEVPLVASKFATLGAAEIPLANFNQPNTYFEIVSYNDNGFTEEASLLNPDSIPRVSNSDEDALNNFGLKLKSNSEAWIVDGETYFISTENESSYNGTSRYITDNSNDISSFEIYLIHSKNITQDKNLGSVLIGMLAYVPVDEVTYEITRIYIQVNMSTKYYVPNEYEGAIAPGKKDSLFISSNSNITENSSFSAYYSLYVPEKDNVYLSDYKRYLSSTHLLPIGTRLTMIDRTNEEEPVFYYYVIDEDNYNIYDTHTRADASGTMRPFYLYPLDKFIRMDSVSENNVFSDEIANVKNYNIVTRTGEEEFIFNVDFSEANITENILKAELLLEIRDSEGLTVYDTLGVSHSSLVYSVYKDQHGVISLTLTKDRDVAYAGYDFYLDAIMDFNEPYSEFKQISDTNFTEERMGIKITLYDSNNNKVNGTSLMGTLFYIKDQAYSAGIDGSIRLKVSDFVADVNANIYVDLSHSTLATDTYRIVVEAFGSPDGLYYGLTSAGIAETTIDIVNENYGLNSIVDEKNVIVKSASGENSSGTNEMKYNIEYMSQFNQANIRVKLYRRRYDEQYSLLYDLVDLQDYVTNELTATNNDYEYLVTNTPEDLNEFIINMGTELMTGTYRIVFELYNGNNYIDSVYNYIFIS